MPMTDEQIKAMSYGNGPAIAELCTRVLKAEAENKRLLERYEGHVKYGIDLARIIESLCAGDEIVEPKTTARHHYNIAVGARAENEILQARVKVLEDALTRIANTTEGDADLDEYGAAEVARKVLEEGK